MQNACLWSKLHEALLCLLLLAEPELPSSQRPPMQEKGTSTLQQQHVPARSPWMCPAHEPVIPLKPLETSVSSLSEIAPGWSSVTSRTNITVWSTPVKADGRGLLPTTVQTYPGDFWSKSCYCCRPKVPCTHSFKGFMGSEPQFQQSRSTSCQATHTGDTISG